MRRRDSIGWKPALALSGLFIMSLSITAWRPDLSNLILPPLGTECDCECTADCEIKSQHAWQCGAAYDGWEESDAGQHGCQTASCEFHQHEECDEEENLDDLLMALSTLDGPDLQRLLDRNPDRLLWNTDRGAVQLLGCGEKVALSIHMSDQQVTSLDDG